MIEVAEVMRNIVVRGGEVVHLSVSLVTLGAILREAIEQLMSTHKIDC